MILTVCAYFDTELDKFQPEFCVPSQEPEIIEGITEAAIKGKVEDCAHKKLFVLGTFDTQDGSFILEKEPRQLMDLSPFAKRNGGEN